jgi:ABC-type antimicrobial peptide transport system permease subunit
VVGVAETVKNGGLGVPADPEYYVVRKHAGDYGRRGFLIVRSRLNADAMAAWIRSEVAGVDASVPVSVESMEQRVSALAVRPRFNAMLLSVFAAAGLLLAAIGLYGVMAFLVAQRTQEIGIRMALGATRAGVITMVLSHAARWTLAGCAVGFMASLSLTRVLRSLLFEAPAQDVTALAGAFGILIAVVFVAAWMPSRRAATVDPMLALRHE